LVTSSLLGDWVGGSAPHSPRHCVELVLVGDRVGGAAPHTPRHCVGLVLVIVGGKGGVTSSFLVSRLTLALCLSLFEYSNLDLHLGHLVPRLTLEFCLSTRT